MFDFFTSVSEIFGFPLRGKCCSGLLFEYTYYIVEYMFVWYTNYSVLWVRLNVINMLDTKKYILLKKILISMVQKLLKDYFSKSWLKVDMDWVLGIKVTHHLFVYYVKFM